jgi:hypothetical protein
VKVIFSPPHGPVPHRIMRRTRKVGDLQPVNVVATRLARRYGYAWQPYHGSVLVFATKDGASTDLDVAQLSTACGRTSKVATVTRPFENAPACRRPHHRLAALYHPANRVTCRRPPRTHRNTVAQLTVQLDRTSASPTKFAGPLDANRGPWRSSRSRGQPAPPGADGVVNLA